MYGENPSEYKGLKKQCIVHTVMCNMIKPGTPQNVQCTLDHSGSIASIWIQEFIKIER